MSANDSETEHLDKHYPFIERNIEPPGRWIDSSAFPGLKQWEGQRGWRTRHGDAVVQWDTGNPSRVWGVLAPDGSRTETKTTLDFGWRRRVGGPRRWIYGKIDVRPNDVIFIDGEQPIYTPPPQTERPDLEADLARDPAFLEAIRDDQFARAVYRVFMNRTFYKETDERSWLCGDRQAARLVRDLRGLGESYHDFFLDTEFEGVYPDDRAAREALLLKSIDDLRRMVAHDLPSPSDGVPEEARAAFAASMKRMLDDPAERERWQKSKQDMLASVEKLEASLRKLDENKDIFERLRSHLTRLGWRTENEQDREAERSRKLARGVAVLQDIKKLEARPEGTVGQWAEALRKQQRAIGGYVAYPKGALDRMSEDERAVLTGRIRLRLYELALTGRAEKAEYDALLARLEGR